jgi:hypothetical protein
MDNGMGNALEGQSIQLDWVIEMAVQNLPPAPLIVLNIFNSSI